MSSVSDYPHGVGPPYNEPTTCLECGRPAWDHLAFYEVATPEKRQGLVEARFPGQPWRGLYCRRAET